MSINRCSTPSEKQPMIRQQTLPATQVVASTPWIINRQDLDLPTVQAEIEAVHSGRQLRRKDPNQAEIPLETGSLRRCSTMSKRSARRKHTAHHSPLSQVHYRHHPLFGQDVRVVRALRQRGAPSVIIELPDGAQIAVPKWMLDPLRCRSMREEDTPIIAIGALVELSALVRLLTPSPSSERPHIVDLEGGPDDAARRPTASAGAPDTVEIHTRGTASTEDRHD